MAEPPGAWPPASSRSRCTMRLSASACITCGARLASSCRSSSVPCASGSERNRLSQCTKFVCGCTSELMKKLDCSKRSPYARSCAWSLRWNQALALNESVDFGRLPTSTAAVSRCFTFIGRQHFRWLVVQVDGVDVDAAVGAGGGAPHRRVESQHRLDEIERGILEGIDRQLVREPVEPQQQLAEVVQGGRPGHRRSFPSRPRSAHPMFR